MKRTLFRYLPGLLLIVLTIALVAVAGQRNIAFSDIKLFVDGEEVAVHTDADTVKDVLHNNQIILDAHDRVNYDLDQKIIDGMNIEVSRAVNVTVIEGERQSLVKTHDKTVADVLAKLNTVVSDQDLVEPSRDTAVVDGLVITIKKMEVREKTIDRDLAYQSVTVEDDQLAYGTVEMVRVGETGLITTVIRENVIDGRVVSTEIVDQQIAQPVSEIIAHGTYVEPVVVSRSEEAPVEPAYVADVSQPVAAEPAPAEPVAEAQGTVMYMTATAYNDIGITFSGVPSGPGKVAVDPNVIPLGTRLLIESVDEWPSYGEAIAADTGSAVIGNIIDLFYYDYQTCINFGRRTVKVTILP
ncbi:MAG TPA: DUF348 domain-containing protein [Tissierellia bacterium]|nr:DUF348 domain-containing protein [Tissierellia bacterium]